MPDRVYEHAIKLQGQASNSLSLDRKSVPLSHRDERPSNFEVKTPQKSLINFTHDKRTSQPTTPSTKQCNPIWRSSGQEMQKTVGSERLTLFSLPQYQTGNLQRRFRPNGVSLRNFEAKVQKEQKQKLLEAQKLPMKEAGQNDRKDTRDKVSNSICMFVKQGRQSMPECQAQKNADIVNANIGAGKAPRKSLQMLSPRPVHGYDNLNSARRESGTDAQKQICWGTTNRNQYGSMGVFGKEDVEQNRAQTLTQIKTGQNNNEHGRAKNKSQNKDSNNVYAPLVHGSAEFQFQRHKARAVSNYGTARHTNRRLSTTPGVQTEGANTVTVSTTGFNTLDPDARNLGSGKPSEGLQQYMVRSPRQASQNSAPVKQKGKKRYSSNFVKVGSTEGPDLYRETVQQSFVKATPSIMESLTGFRTPRYLCSTHKLSMTPGTNSKGNHIQQMNKDALQSTYNAYMQTNSLVRKKAMKNHNDAMGKVPNKYNDSSKRQYSQMVKYRRDMEQNKITNRWRMDVYRPGLK